MNSIQINNLQHLYGNAKIFVDINNTTTGTSYLWDKEFIRRLDDYFKGLPVYKMSKADRENINIYINYADEKLKNTDEKYVVFKEFDKFLGSL